VTVHEDPLLGALHLLTIGRRLGLLLIGVAVYSVAVLLVVRHYGFEPLAGGAELELINGVILGLLLSFRNRAAYDRWWEARRLWGQLTNDCRNLACKLAAFVPAAALADSSLPNLLAAFPEALKRHLRRESPRLQDLPGFEKDQTSPTHLPSYLAGRLYAVVASWNRSGLIHDTMLRVLDTNLRGLLDVCGGCERILSTPLSPSYKALLRTGIVVNLLAAPWLTPLKLGLWGMAGIEFGAFFLLGVELVDTVIEEPFGRERDDLDLDRYCRTIGDNVKTCLAAGPEAMQTQNRE
jgi:ion channel-forming bestrophin family protein